MHLPVLLKEVIALLDFQDGDNFLDATLGLGGHSLAVCRQFPSVRIIGLDRDGQSLLTAKERLKTAGCQLEVYQADFRDLDRALAQSGKIAVDKILFDLGFSSSQLEQAGRGFSFQRDEPLLMTFNDNPPAEALTAERIVNSWPRERLEDIFRNYGQEKSAGRIAAAIVRQRRAKPIRTSGALSELIVQTVSRYSRIHPATRVFQALRIAVNDELGALSEALPKAWERLKPAGRMAVITFQSLEDRLVKTFFRQKVKEQQATLIAKKPVRPNRSEIKENPRCRSAKLRVIKKNEEI